MARLSSSSPLVLVGLLAVACGTVEGEDPDAAPVVPPVDGADAAVDAAPLCTPDTSTCASGTQVACDGDGQPVPPRSCALGCDPGGTRCVDVAPASGLGPSLDGAAGQPALVLGGGAILHTGNGSVVDGDGDLVTVASDELEADGVPVRVFRVGSADLGATTVQGDAALVIVADGPIVIRGALSLRASGRVGGPGSRTCVGSGNGGSSSTDLESYQFPGAGGGGAAQHGASGGAAAGGTRGLGGTVIAAGIPATRLLGGCPGGGVVHLDDDGSNEYGRGGGGGGAIHLVSRVSISIIGGGSINVGGGGGGELGGGADASGAGGGSGGRIVLEAPQVVVTGPGSALAANGGGGGGGCGAQARGADGLASDAPAPGGSCSTAGTGSGGQGGTVRMPGIGASGTGSAGGGGGGAGSIYIATVDRTVTIGNGAVVSPEPLRAQLTTR
jgi:hypothetical protein